VQHSFSSWSDCWNASPTFNRAEVEIKDGNIFPIGSNLKRNITDISHVEYFLFQRPIEEGRPLPTCITINAYADNMVNDTHLEYDCTGNNLQSGVHDKSADASDPCNNYMSISREGYTQKTTIAVDGPIKLANVSKDAQGSTKSVFKAEGELFTLQVGGAYWEWSKSKARLEVA
jgi:hypothetical protein